MMVQMTHGKSKDIILMIKVVLGCIIKRAILYLYIMEFTLMIGLEVQKTKAKHYHREVIII